MGVGNSVERATASSAAGRQKDRAMLPFFGARWSSSGKASSEVH